MNYTNLLRDLAGIATRAATAISEAQAEPHKGIDIDVPLRVLVESTQAIAAIETATRPRPEGMGITSADARAILDTLASLRRADGGE